MSDDLISRQAAIDAVSEAWKCGAYYIETINAIKDLPSAQKEGEWIFSRGDGKTCADGWNCSVCDNSFHTNVPYFEEFHFCPNCGARMRKGAER